MNKMSSPDWLQSKVAAAIRARREQIGMSQDELAKWAGLTRSSVTNMEAGRQAVSLERLYCIASALRCEPSRLLPTLRTWRRHV